MGVILKVHAYTHTHLCKHKGSEVLVLTLAGLHAWVGTSFNSAYT
jgi:hypothetical protein